ncbi:hypothetical protein [Pedobacter cryoconitis]|uniref:Carboxypeptidase family protein n=1 Tax=Pedobacter cryoconitis TaxID=188932 RepID=A0A327SAN7_9SPHI|nr:hypothetical protein [Pedobacter cryoconitis]RAJ26149.1 hypothetical protein LY11_03854 [Pedobacter cryoconitis]
MKSKFTILTAMAFAILIAGCSKDKFNENDAINAQKDLLNLKYQHELDLETLKQKGATAMQQLINTAALEQLKLNDSLKTKSNIAASKQDYTVKVVDVISNAPLADADVTVSSEGKIFAAKTNAQGIVTFTALYLFPTSTFLVSKTGYAATQISQYLAGNGSVKLWNTSDISNEITGSLYIETDLTNNTPEKAGAKVLVTAFANIPTNNSDSYTVYFPTYTDAAGVYSLKLPAAPSGYTLLFEQITADQKLYVNSTEDDAVASFPNSLPRLTTVKTYFNVNNFNAQVPLVNNYYYFKVAPDKSGRTLYTPGYNNNYYGYNQVFVSVNGSKFQIEKLFTNNYNNSGNPELNMYTYEPNAKVDVELVDITGTIVETAPKLVATAGPNGKLIYTASDEGGNGYFHLKRDAAGMLVPGAKGVFLKAALYDQYSNLYTLNFNNSLNTVSSRYVSSNYLLSNKGDKKVVNFYYGAGDSRVKQVY